MSYFSSVSYSIKSSTGNKINKTTNVFKFMMKIFFLTCMLYAHILIQQYSSRQLISSKSLQYCHPSLNDIIYTFVIIL